MKDVIHELRIFLTICLQGWRWTSALKLYDILRLVHTPQTNPNPNPLLVWMHFPCFPQTYIGNMLLSVNPFKPLNIYTEELRQKYQGKEQQRNPPWDFHTPLLCFFSLSISGVCLAKHFSSFGIRVSLTCLIELFFLWLCASAMCMPSLTLLSVSLKPPCRTSASS